MCGVECEEPFQTPTEELQQIFIAQADACDLGSGEALLQVEPGSMHAKYLRMQNERLGIEWELDLSVTCWEKSSSSRMATKHYNH